jgi:hypothetical protein
MTDWIHRKSCTVCGSVNLLQHKIIKDFPVYMGVTENNIHTDIFGDQIWGKCEICGCLQLLKLAPLDILYSQNHFYEAVGLTWKRHHENFANFILEKNINEEEIKEICEIGSAHGYLANLILDKIPTLTYTAIEPDPKGNISRLKLIRGYVENNLKVISESKNIVHSHVLEHVYNVKEFLESVTESMQYGATMFVSFPNIQRLLELHGTNSLNFEHTYFLHPDQLRTMASNCGLFIEKEEKFEEHSFFFKFVKKTPISRVNMTNITKYISFFDEMWLELEGFVNGILKKREDLHGEIYLFGAHVFSQALYQLGLNTIPLAGVLDNSTGKQGHRLYGTQLQVFSPTIINGLDEVTVIMKSSHYRDEISIQLKELNANVLIID